MYQDVSNNYHPTIHDYQTLLVFCGYYHPMVMDFILSTAPCGRNSASHLPELIRSWLIASHHHKAGKPLPKWAGPKNHQTPKNPTWNCGTPWQKKMCVIGFLTKNSSNSPIFLWEKSDLIRSNKFSATGGTVLSIHQVVVSLHISVYHIPGTTSSSFVRFFEMWRTSKFAECL